MLYATVSRDYRIHVGMMDLLAGHSEWFRRALNKAIGDEFTHGGVVFDPSTDFFEIIQKVVMREVGPQDPDYDDFFQEVAMGFLDRQKGVILKDWIHKIVKMQEAGTIDAKKLPGWLYSSAKNYVIDLRYTRSLKQKRQVQIRPPGQDPEVGGGVDLDRLDTDANQGHESEVSARELYDTLMRELKDERSRKILQIIVESGIKGFLRGKGLMEVTREYGASNATAMTYYRDKVFKPDLEKALRRIGDKDLIERAQDVFASHPRAPRMALVCDELGLLA